MKQLKTKKALLAALEKAATRQLTADELYEQRVSYIMGSLKNSSNVTRAKVKEVLDAQQGKKSA